MISKTMAYKTDILLGHIIKLYGHNGEVMISLGDILEIIYRFWNGFSLRLKGNPFLF